MNFIRSREFTANLASILGVQSDSDAPIRLWLNRTWLKWFTTHPDFALFFAQVKYEAPSVMFEGMFEGKYFATSSLSPKLEVFTNLSEYEKRDARAGILYAYASGIRSLPFMVSTTEWGQFLLQVRDYFRDILAEKPDLILNKYTVEHLPRLVKEWHADEDKRRARETQKDWSVLVEGRDWWPVAKSDDGEWTLIRLCSPASLDLEAQRMHHCIDGAGYKQMLFSTTGLLLSLRRTAAISSPVASIEAHRNGLGCSIVQFMKPCNVAVAQGSPEYNAFLQCTKKATESAEVGQTLLPLGNSQLKGSANGDLEYTLDN